MNAIDSKTALQLDLMTLRPRGLLQEYIKNVDDLYIYRRYVRDTHCQAKDLDYLLDLVLGALSEKRRFRQLDCIKVLKRVTKNSCVSQGFPEATIKRIFTLYQHYVFSDSEEVQWAVSVMLKGQFLTGEQIQWLIDHFQESVHIVNRLLRYPERHHLITKWAQSAFRDPSLLERQSELMGLLISKEIPRFAAEADPITIAWGIYYSRSRRAVKIRLLKMVIGESNFDAIVEIAKRCNFPEVIEFLLTQIEVDKRS